MSLSPPEIQKLVDLVRATQPVEIDCDECLMRVGEYAERILAGSPVPESLTALEEHLSICDECREEFEMLRVVLGK